LAVRFFTFCGAFHTGSGADDIPEEMLETKL
jgi:hypothetical protein